MIKYAKIFFILWFVTLSVIVLYPKQSFALSCAVQLTLEDAYETYDGVIIGEVEKVKRKNKHNELTVSVIKSFKEIQTEKITVIEDMMWGNKDGPSEVGEEYLFFLTLEEGKWENKLCSPSEKVNQATFELWKDRELVIEPEPAPAKLAMHWMISFIMGLLRIIFG